MCVEFVESVWPLVVLGCGVDDSSPSGFGSCRPSGVVDVLAAVVSLTLAPVDGDLATSVRWLAVAKTGGVVGAELVFVWGQGISSCSHPPVSTCVVGAADD